jgi:hypothetical protein
MQPPAEGSWLVHRSSRAAVSSREKMSGRSPSGVSPKDGRPKKKYTHDAKVAHAHTAAAATADNYSWGRFAPRGCPASPSSREAPRKNSATTQQQRRWTRCLRQPCTVQQRTRSFWLAHDPLTKAVLGNGGLLCTCVRNGLSPSFRESRPPPSLSCDPAHHSLGLPQIRRPRRGREEVLDLKRGHLVSFVPTAMSQTAAPAP